MSAERKLYVFGSNRDGQLGISYGDDCAQSPVEVGHIEGSSVSRVSLNQHQTFIVQDNGVIVTAGSNDNNELGRTGKRSLFHRVDALETFLVREASIGSGFFNLLTDDGRLVSWGINDLGQLGNNTRDNKDKPRVNTTIQEPLLQIASGATHSIGLTKSGRVITWGGNRWGQLGDGQLTSSTKIHVPLQLRHRPVISVACGENHSLVMTVGGNVYSWGENTQGQLGLTDTINRLRPELIKALRSMGATKIAAGRNHSLVISQSGLLLTFGSNNHGQCGVDSEVKIQPQPMVVDRLRELRAVDVSGGFAHTLVLCEVPGSAMSKVYVMGLNSSGQLGLGSTMSQSTPTLLTLPDPAACPIGVATGPMAMHSLVLTTSILETTEGTTHAHSFQDCNPLRQQALPAVHLDKVASLVMRFKDAYCVNPTSDQTTSAFVKVREMISAAFSSIPVLNASFLLPAEQIGHGSLCVDLKAVRSAYEHIMSTEAYDPLGVVTLGRATLHLADQLKECPVDDAENLSVFLIALENPLMLRASSFHVAIELVIRGILSIPKYYRLILFKWLKSYPSEYFGRVLQVLQGFLTLILTNQALKLDPTPVVLVLETLYQCNVEEKIVPESLFYNEAVPRTVKLQKEWILFRSQSFNSSVFNYCSYPFLVPEVHKLNLLRFEFKNQQDMQVALSHRNLPIAAYLRDRIALLAAAGHALQQLQLQQQQAVPEATTSDQSPSDQTSTNAQDAIISSTSPVTATSTTSTGTSNTTTATTSTLSTNTTSTPPGAPFPLPPSPLPPSPSATRTNMTGAVVSFLSSAQVDAVIQQALPYLPAEVTQSSVRLPAGVNISYDIFDGLAANLQLWLEISVDRNRLLPDLIEQLDAIMKEDSNTLFLPLKVSFKGEIGVDYGGVKREFFTIAIKEILGETNLLGTCANGNMVWFTNQPLKATPMQRQNSTASTTSVAAVQEPEDFTSSPRKLARLDAVDGAINPGMSDSTAAFAAASAASQLAQPASVSFSGDSINTSPRNTKYDRFVLSRPLAYYLGLLIGLAAYNEVHVDVPLPSCIYKIIKGEQLTLTDLWAVDSSLAAGLQALLNFEEGAGSIEDVFAVTFTASANPLLGRSETGSSNRNESGYLELIPGGEDILVSRGNRAQFVKCFVQHALHGSVATQIAQYIQGLQTCFHKAALQMCSATEIEHILCGSKDIGDLKELRPSTTYKGSYTDTSPIVQWFWDYLSSLSLSDKRKFLHFVTGSERAPLGGLSNLKLTVQSIAQAENALPTSHTCFNILNIPDSYSSAEQLKNRFAVALKYHEGFGLV